MKQLLALLLSFQFLSTPVHAQLGEKQSFNPTGHPADALIAEQALAFANDAEVMMDELKKNGISKFLESADYASEAEKKSVMAILTKTGAGSTPVFKRTKTGEWVMQVYGHQVSMSINDLYQRQIVINGQTLSYANESIESFERRVREKLAPGKTSWLKQFWQHVSVPEAQAMEPISALVIVAVAVAILGTALYLIHFKPKAATELLVKASLDLKAKADACDTAGQSQQNYDNTFALASSVRSRTTLNSITDSQLALQNELRKTLEKPNESVSCEESVRAAAQKVKISVPTAEQLASARERRLIREAVLAPTSETDVTGALLQMCGEYQRLASCMSQFVSHHVHDGETIEDFNRSTPDINQYNRNKNAAGR